MTTCSMTSRLIFSVAIGFAIGALTSGLDTKTDDCDFLQSVTSSRSANRAELNVLDGHAAAAWRLPLQGERRG